MKPAAALLLLSGLLVSCVAPPPHGPFVGQAERQRHRPGEFPTGAPRLDPRGRPPLGLWEIDYVAHRVAAASGRRVAGSVHESHNPGGPVASIQATSGGDRIIVNPRAAREIPPNAWAFIFGHEFAHQVHNFGHRGHTDPAQELRADIIGATYARKAGYQLVPYIHWMLSRAPNVTPSHGDFHARARALARHFNVSTSIEGRR